MNTYLKQTLLLSFFLFIIMTVLVLDMSQNLAFVNKILNNQKLGFVYNLFRRKILA